MSAQKRYKDYKPSKQDCLELLGGNYYQPYPVYTPMAFYNPPSQQQAFVVVHHTAPKPPHTIVHVVSEPMAIPKPPISSIKKEYITNINGYPMYKIGDKHFLEDEKGNFHPV